MCVYTGIRCACDVSCGVVMIKNDTVMWHDAAKNVVWPVETWCGHVRCDVVCWSRVADGYMAV